jgi:hypothetical protein
MDVRVNLPPRLSAAADACLLPGTTTAWHNAVQAAASRLGPHWPQTDEPTTHTTEMVVATVALIIYLLPPDAPADAVECALDAGTDVEDEPQVLSNQLRRGLADAGHTADSDPLVRLSRKLLDRESFDFVDVPIFMTGGLTRWNSELHSSAPLAYRLLAPVQRPANGAAWECAE